VGFLSIAQTISLGVFLFGAAMLAFSLIRTRKAADATSKTT
jgi:hypothetical protein